MSGEKVMRKALFAGSFDPFTAAHAAIVEEALRLFDVVVVGVGCNIAKCGLLDTEARVRLIEELYSQTPRVEVVSYQNLTTECAREVGATILVRGVRGASDLETESVMDRVNRRLNPSITTVLLLTPAEMNHISSSCVRELLRFGEREAAEEMLPEGVEITRYINI